MTKEQLASRMLSTEGEVGGTKLRTGKLTEDEWVRLIEAGDILSKTQIYFDDTPGITVPEMKAKLRRLKDVDLVIIDYLQLMSGAKRIDNRVQEISEITRNLKIMAKEINVPVITCPSCPCQRAAYGAPPGAFRSERFRIYRAGRGYRFCSCTARITQYRRRAQRR